MPPCVVELVAHYSLAAMDYSDCKQALAVVTEALGSLRSIIAELENTEKLIELQEDVGGVQDLVHQGRVRTSYVKCSGSTKTVRHKSCFHS